MKRRIHFQLYFEPEVFNIIVIIVTILRLGFPDTRPSQPSLSGFLLSNIGTFGCLMAGWAV